MSKILFMLDNLPPTKSANGICVNQLLKCFNVTLEALDKVLNFIEDNNLKKHNRSDYINYLIGYFVFHRDEITEKQKDLLINWYNTVNFVNKSNTERRKLYANLLKL